MSTVAAVLLWLVIVPLGLGLAWHVLLRAIPKLYGWGTGWGGVVFVLPVLFIAWLIRRPFPPGYIDDATPMRQISKVCGTWIIGVTALPVAFLVWLALSY